MAHWRQDQRDTYPVRAGPSSASRACGRTLLPLPVLAVAASVACFSSTACVAAYLGLAVRFATERGARLAKSNYPVHRSIFAVDIQGSTSRLRTNPVKEQLRAEVYSLLYRSMGDVGIVEAYRDPPADRGDGVLVTIRPADQVPKTLLLNRLAPRLTSHLVDYNRGLPEAERPQRQLRLRAVVHAGEVHFDGRGCFGEAVDLAFRLLNAPRFKACLAHGSSPLALIVSEDIYWSIVRHDYDGIRSRDYHQIAQVTVTGRRHRGWVHIPWRDRDGEARFRLAS
jgi:class 3 adenylate cyclase